MTVTTGSHRRGRVSRRGFLQSSALAGATGLVGPSVLARGARAQGMSGEVLTGSHWGAFHAKVDGGRIVDVRGWEKDPHPSKQLPGVIDSVYSATRIKYPMVRKAWLDGGPGTDTAARGRDDFVRVSWDQALDFVAAELQRVESEYGPAATYAGSYGWKSPGKLHNCQNLLRRMMNLKGSFVNSSGDYSTAASQIIMPHVMGTLEVYEQQTAWPVLAEHTDLLVFWGADPMTTNQIGWVVPDHGGYAGMAQFKDTGKPVICIDPVRTETAKYFGAELIQPKPQTDVAMMMGVAHTLLTEGLHDEDFLYDYTVGYEEFFAYLRGETGDSVEKTPEWAAAICGVDADTIRTLARRIAAGRTMLASGWSLQRMHHGEQAHWTLVTIASMLGQIGLPGGGFGLSYHYANGGSPSADSVVLPGITDGGKAVEGAAWLTESGSATIPVARVVDMLEFAGQPFSFNGTDGTWPDVKMAYWVGGNPFAHHQDRNRMLRAWQKLETFIVQDFQWTATARHADIVLPATTSYERNDIEQVGDYALAHVLAMKKVVDPVFEARNDYDIFLGICERLGKASEFTEGKSEMDWIEEFYNEGLKQAKAKGLDMPEFDDFWNGDGVVSFPVTSGNEFVRYQDYRDDPLLNPLGTPSGKIEIYSRTIEAMGYDDCPPHPTWMEPVERLDGPTTRYPLHVATSHPDNRLHSQLNGTVLRDRYAVAGREPCLINTEDAAERGIADGDVVRVFNDRGQLLAGAVLSDDIMRGVIRINEGGWFDPAEPGTPGSVDKYGDVNCLTVDIGTSRLAQGNCGHTAVADVEKFTGEVPAVTVFDEPASQG